MATKSANKSGVSAQTLSLPKGGGAIRGMGEKFQADLHTGTGNFSVPLSLPPGRHNFAPQLALAYTTGAGNSPFGLGWSLGIPHVARKISKGVPLYDDEQDTFILSGAEDLVEVNREVQGTRLTIDYRPRTEGLFARIAHVVDAGQNYWDVTTREGVRNFYGSTVSSQVAASKDGAEQIFAWYLHRSEDPFGNRILYHYQVDEGPIPAEPNHTYNQIYLRQIEYCNYRHPGTQTEAFLFQVDFDYGQFDDTETETNVWSLRTDSFSSYRSGFEIRTVRRCQRILVRSLHPTANAPTHLINSYDLDYEQDALSGVSLLRSVVHRGYDINPPGAESRDWDFASQTDIPAHPHRQTNLYVVSFPPVSFQYTGFAPERRTIQFLSFGCDHPPEHGLNDPNYELIDLYGNGLPDILHTAANGHYGWRNLGEGRFTAPRRLRSAPVGVYLEDEAVQFADMQGNGSADLLVTEGLSRGFYENNFSGEWGRFHPYTQAPSFSLKDPNVRLVDLDGDGMVDVLATFDHHFLYIQNRSQNGHLEFAIPIPIPRQHDLEAWPDVYFSHPENRVRLADMSGDGLQDIVLVHEGRIDYWPNLGHGRWGRRITLLNGPHLPGRYDPRRLMLSDINGDGIADLIYVDSGCVYYWINQSGNRWSEQQVIACTPPVTDADSVRIADMNGSGTGGILWSYEWAPTHQRNYLYFDFTGGEKPLLLHQIDNHMGALTQVEYRPSTDFYVADQKSGTPWKTTLPFPVNVVSRVVVTDCISNNQLTTRYTYHHGYYDGREQEFRGFGRVEQLDTEVLTGGELHVPPVLTKTWFHTGAYFEGDRISQQFLQEYYQESDPLGGGSPLSPEQLQSMLLDDTVLSPDLSAEEAYEACRALRGMTLRQEIYALDSSDATTRPYSVSERNYTVNRLQPGSDNQYAIFFVHPRETVDFHYERQLYDVGGQHLADPGVTHSMTLAVDDYGNVLESVAIAYGRRHPDPNPVLTPADQQQQQQSQITYTQNHYTNPILETDAYRAPLLYEAQTYELLKVTPRSNLPGVTNLFRLEEMQDRIREASDGQHDLPYEDIAAIGAAANHPYRRLIEQVRTLYRRNDLTGAAPLGQLESLALPFESYKLAFTPGLIQQVYVASGKLNPVDINAVLTNEGKYVHSEGDANWWIPSGQVFYSPNQTDTPVQELAYARQHYFMPCRAQDPFGVTTTITYDAYDLLVQETCDPVGNRITVGQNDYRVLQPCLILDPNRNRSAVAFDALGMVVRTAVMGKPGEAQGDSLDGFDLARSNGAIATYLQDPLAHATDLLQRATTRLVYDLFAYWRTRTEPQPQPVVVSTLARETHESDLAGAHTRIQHSFLYSDGFGREIQTKIQAEPEDRQNPQPRWVGTGRKIYNNKGKPVKQYEPFFSNTHQYETEKALVEPGVTPILFYDPVERVVATLHPNHTYEKVVFDAWQQATWDVNDTIIQTQPIRDAVKLPTDDPDVGYFFRVLNPRDYLAFRNPNDANEIGKTWYQARIDNSLGTAERVAAEKAAAHAGTPTVAYLDTLGRTFLTLAHNGFDQNGNPIRYLTRVVLDIEGNQRRVVDAKDRIVMTYDYDLLSNRIYQSSMEAGERWMLNDVTGKPIRTWDSRGHRFRTEYDPLRRPLKTWVTGADPDHPNQELLTDRLVYGEQHPEAELLNLRGQAYLHLDQAGAVTNESHDFKGNLLRSSRQIATEYKRAIDWRTVDIDPVALPKNSTTAIELNALNAALKPFLEAEIFTGHTSFDALNRPIQMIAPHSNLPGATRNVIQPGYNEANLLDRLDVWLECVNNPAGLLDRSVVSPSQVGVENIDYNAKGQRLRIEYKNGATTCYDYDPDTFRLIHLYTRRDQTFTEDCGNGDPAKRFAAPDHPPPNTPCGLQNLHYTYDPVGNITHIRDEAQQTIFFRNQRVEPSAEYTYDAIYRLIDATGREHLGQTNGQRNAPTPPDAFNSFHSRLDHPGDGNAMGTYVEQYVYDEVGNFIKMKHRGSNPQHPGWTRRYIYTEDSLIEPGKASNRLSSTTLKPNNLLPERYRHDAHGNMTRMPHLANHPDSNAPNVHWDYRDQLQQVDLGGGGTAYYTYDGSGQRVRKVWEKSPGLIEERIYLGSFEVFRSRNGQGGVTLERETLHIMDDRQRIALVETRTKGNDPSPKQLIRCQFSNHLGSTSLELDEYAQIISYEEYTPYGSTSYQAVRNQTETPKRYRYSGKERDEESGMYYHGARYYPPYLGIWISCDPAQEETGALNLYEYVSSNPVCKVDLDGRDDDDITNPRITLSSKDELQGMKQYVGKGVKAQGQALSMLAQHARVGAGQTELAAIVNSKNEVFLIPGFEDKVFLIEGRDYKFLGHTHTRYGPPHNKPASYYLSQEDIEILRKTSTLSTKIFTPEGVATWSFHGKRIEALIEPYSSPSRYLTFKSLKQYSRFMTGGGMRFSMGKSMGSFSNRPELFKGFLGFSGQASSKSRLFGAERFFRTGRVIPLAFNLMSGLYILSGKTVEDKIQRGAEVAVTSVALKAVTQAAGPIAGFWAGVLIGVVTNELERHEQKKQQEEAIDAYSRLQSNTHKWKIHGYSEHPLIMYTPIPSSTQKYLENFFRSR